MSFFRCFGLFSFFKVGLLFFKLGYFNAILFFYFFYSILSFRLVLHQQLHEVELCADFIVSAAQAEARGSILIGGGSGSGAVVAVP